MFLQVSVILFTGGGCRGAIPACIAGGIPACIAGGIPACLAACLAAGLQGVVSQHALQVSRPTPRGEVEGDLARGFSRPTTKGEVEGDLAWGVSRPTPRGGTNKIRLWEVGGEGVGVGGQMTKVHF